MWLKGEFPFATMREISSGSVRNPGAVVFPSSIFASVGSKEGRELSQHNCIARPESIIKVSQLAIVANSMV